MQDIVQIVKLSKVLKVNLANAREFAEKEKRELISSLVLFFGSIN